MQATVQTVSSEPKVTKTGKTYYGVQVDGGQWLNVFRRFNIGDVIEYEEGNLPNWPRNVRLAAGDPGSVKDVVKLGKFIELTTLQTLLGNIFELAHRVGIKDDQAIVALNNTLLIALNRQGYQFDLTSLLKTPF